MAVPNLKETRAAASVISALTPDDFDRRRSAEIGDELAAFFAILARRVSPQDSESATVMRVRLMMASYFLRGELEPLPATPPDEQAARAAAQAVGALSDQELDARIEHEVGDAVMAFFEAFAGKVMPERDPEALPRKVHLMAIAYLLRADLNRAS